MLSCYNQGSRYYRINDIDLALNWNAPRSLFAAVGATNFISQN